MKLRLMSTVSLTAAAVIAMAVPALAGPPALSYTPDPQFWGTNGRVMQILPAGDKVILAGSFDYIGPQTGYGVGVDESAGTMLPGAPIVNGTVYAAIPDGDGGWYIGGDFTSVGGVFRHNAAEIAADGTLTHWNPSPDGPVYALAVTDGSVVLGGAFATVDTLTANRLAAVDPDHIGDLTPGWSASADAPVRALVPTAQGLLVGGDFSSVDGLAHRGLARIVGSTGALDTTFTATANASVRTIALTPDASGAYLGGAFTAVGPSGSQQGRNRLAEVDTATGALQGWNPGSDNTVMSLAVDPSAGTVYAGGLFGTVGGVSRAYLAGIGSDGSTTAFDAALSGCNIPHVTKYTHKDPPCLPEVDALSIDNGMLFVGGRFGYSGLTQRHDAAAFSLSDLSVADWNPVASNRPLVLSPSNGNIFVGGDLTSVNGLVRKHIAALDATTGAGIPSWQADADNAVLTLLLSPDGSTVYLGGHFKTVSGLKRNKLAAVNTADGSLVSTFKPAANNDVLSMAWGNNSLYISGQFKRIGQVDAGHVAKLDPATGAVDTSFTANTVGPAGHLTAYGMVESIAVAPDGSKVYLGGPFDTVNGVFHRGIAVVDGLTGAMLPNQLGGIQRCWTNGDWLVHLYLSPDGKRLYGGDVCPDYIYQWDAVNLSSPSKPTGLNWKTSCNGGMQGALEVNGTFYYGSHGGDRGRGGYCWASPTNQTRVSQQRFFEFDATTGALLPGRTEFDTAMGVWSFAAGPNGLLVGGDFTWSGNVDQVHKGLLLLPGTP
jgi:hypothetical protein